MSRLFHVTFRLLFQFHRSNDSISILRTRSFLLYNDDDRRRQSVRSRINTSRFTLANVKTLNGGRLDVLELDLYEYKLSMQAVLLIAYNLCRVHLDRICSPRVSANSMSESLFLTLDFA